MPVENITRACGHVQEFHWNDAEPDLARRKEKFAATRCRACSHDLHEQNRRAHEEALARRRQKRDEQAARAEQRQRGRLRDEFAMAALSGLGYAGDELSGSDYPNIAERCYKLADALLRQRDMR